jgi:hypothetical protein
MGLQTPRFPQERSRAYLMWRASRDEEALT